MSKKHTKHTKHTQRTLCLTGGGSGGHIYPALAIAEEIQSQRPDVEIILVGARRGLEKKLFKKTKFKSYFLPVGQFHSSVGRLKQIWSLLKMPYCFFLSFWILLKHRPSVVMGVGGYASGPVCMVSVFLNIPTFIWEGNATPGVTNKILGYFKITPFLVFKEAQSHFKKVEPIITGFPVRKALEHNPNGLNSPNNHTNNEKNLKTNKTNKTNEANKVNKTNKTNEINETNETNKDINVLFVGGSQGARVFNNTLPQLAKNYDLKGFQIVHQTGFKNYESTLASYGESKKQNIKILPYLDPIKEHYLNADVVVSRSGAGAVNELSLLAKSCVLVPFPKASDDHQKKNAESLVLKNSAIMIEESTFNAEKLFEVLCDLRDDPSHLKDLGANMQKSLKRGAREKISTYLLKFL